MDQTDHLVFLMSKEDLCREETQIVLKARVKILIICRKKKQTNIAWQPSTEGLGFLALLQTNVVLLDMMFGPDEELRDSREIMEEHAVQWQPRALPVHNSLVSPS